MKFMNDRADNIRRIKQAASEKPVRIGIPKISEKRAKRVEEDKKISVLDAAFYKSIWSKRSHVCYECGCKLWGKKIDWFMHHLLEKAAYPQFRYTEENIALLCPAHHDQVRFDIDKVPKIKQLTEQIRKQLLNENNTL